MNLMDHWLCYKSEKLRISYKNTEYLKKHYNVNILVDSGKEKLSAISDEWMSLILEGDHIDSVSSKLVFCFLFSVYLFFIIIFIFDRLGVTDGEDLSIILNVQLTGGKNIIILKKKNPPFHPHNTPRQCHVLC